MESQSKIPEFYPTAKVIADSINLFTGSRLTTFVCKYHRFIHSELMTHRVFSRNSSSSRAIPTSKLIENLINDNVYPLHWGKNQKGMQASVELSDNEKLQGKLVWEEARTNAINTAKKFVSLGIHKQIVNRVLEPFSTITVIISTTSLSNFFEQRCHKDAQPEIQAIAREMQSAYESSIPKELRHGEWHIPYVDDFIVDKWNPTHELKVSVGRCARVSYLNHEGDKCIKDDVFLHDRLIGSTPKHLSPFEHQAVSLAFEQYYGNFHSFKQYRKFVEKGDIV